MKPKVVVPWILQVFLAFLLLSAGGMKLAGGEQMVESFHQWGYSEGFLYFIGGAEVLGAIGLLIPRLSALSAVGLMVIMLGAAYTHLAHGDGISATLPALVLFVLLGGVTYLRRQYLFGFFPFLKK